MIRQNQPNNDPPAENSSEIISKKRITISLKEGIATCCFLVTAGFFGGIFYTIKNDVQNIQNQVKEINTLIIENNTQLKTIEIKIENIQEQKLVQKFDLINTRLSQIEGQLKEMAR